MDERLADEKLRQKIAAEQDLRDAEAKKLKLQHELKERFDNVEYAVSQIAKAHVQYVEGAITGTEFVRWALILPVEMNELQNVQQELEFNDQWIETAKATLKSVGKFEKLFDWK